MRSKYAYTTEKEEIPTIYGVWTGKDYRPSSIRIFLSHNSNSCAAVQFHSDASMEAVDEQLEKLAFDDRRWRQCVTIDACSHGGEWPYSLLQEIGSKLINCYRCTNIGFFNLSTSASPWIVYKGVFIQDPFLRKPSRSASSMDSCE